MTVAVNDGSGLKYLLTDHLGSIVAVTNASGALLSEQRYLPFGQVRTDVGTITETDLGYTGQRNLDAQEIPYSLGLMDYKARFYDPYNTHFSQPDSIVPDLYNPQSLNRYSYASNNPIRYNDPSGHCIDEGDAPPNSPANRNICPKRKESNDPNKSILIGSLSGMRPYLMEQSDSSCGHCSWEPEIQNPFEVLDFVFGAIQNLVSMAQEPNIFIYLNYSTDSNGNVTVPSLTIDNESSTDISIMSVSFSVRGLDYQSYNYRVIPEDMIYPTNTLPGIRAGGNALSVSQVHLTPSGDFLYPDNRFGPNDLITLALRIADSHSGQYIPINPYSFNFQQLGVSK